MHKGRAKPRLFGVLATLLLVVCSIFFTFRASNQNAHAADISQSYNWNQLKIGGGGWITGIVAQPTTPGLLYGRADVGGLYRWNESTQTWTQLFVAGAVPNPTPSDYNVESVAVSKTNNQLVYAAVGITYNFTTDTPAGRILKSTDQGRTWTDNGQRWKISGNSDNRQESERLAIDPNNENVVYFGSRNMGLWRTTDGGNTWSQISSSMVPVVYTQGDNSPAGIKFVVFDPTSGTTNGRTNIIYAGVTGSGIYESKDGGDSWTNIYPTTSEIEAADVGSDGNAYFSVTDGHLQRYTPSTNTWKDVSPSGNPNYLTVSVDPFNPQRIIVGTSPVSGGHLWRTTNGGASWDTLNVSLASADIPWITNTDEGNWLSVGNIIFDPQVPDRLWFGQGTGVWRADGLSGSTITWNFVSKGIEEMVSTDIVAPPGGQPVNTNWDRQGFYHANPDQYPQKELVNDKFSSGWDLDYSGNNPQFLVATISDHRFINPDYSGYSTDGGQTWTPFSATSTSNDRFAGDIAVSATDTNNIVWLPTYGRNPYVSTDRGASWHELTSFNGVTGLHVQYYLSQLKLLASDKVDGTFYIYSSSGAFYRSSNSGQTWEKAAGAPAGGSDAWVFSQIHAVPGHAGSVWASTAQGGLAYTEDKGDTWTKISAVQESHSFGFGAPLPGSSYPTVYANAKINDQWGVWRSSDKGVTWDLVSANPLGIYDVINVVNGDMNIPGRVYVGFTGNGFVYGDTQSGGSGTPTATATTPAGTPTATSTPTGSQPIPDGHYKLSNRFSNLVLDDTSAGGAGTHQEQWADNGGSNQHWTFTSVGGGYYKITCDANGLALDIDGASTSDGAAAVLQNYTGVDDQLWQLVPTDSGYYDIVNKNSGKLLNDNLWSQDNGGTIIQYSHTGGSNEQWLPTGV
ncbi:RICIN domain-containing protein [Dictyobacter kobayashii]|uniref:Carbohydrate-binding protein n=1 Tax=Dictyobacter kobayashii TaxID=2014872 RepID=A0A402ANG7_9CHLR|nr:RICIN domain-containing protein [Dictyobacter kobayashii]GCE20574.1 carbohydrate-binding protein [Dictyobacter kobayashii]